MNLLKSLVEKWACKQCFGSSSTTNGEWRCLQCNQLYTAYGTPLTIWGVDEIKKISL